MSFPGKPGEHQCWCWLCGLRDAFSRFGAWFGLLRCWPRDVLLGDLFSREVVSALGSTCRDLCRDDCRDAVLLRLVEALPLSERLGHTAVRAMPFFKRFGHTMLAMLRNLAATFCKVSEVVLLAWGGCENFRLLAMSELALQAWGMQNSPEKGEVPRVICLNEMVPDGSSRPSHGLPSSSPPPGIPRLPGGLNWAPRCSPKEWTAWCRVRDGLDVSNDFF